MKNFNDDPGWEAVIPEFAAALLTSRISARTVEASVLVGWAGTLSVVALNSRRLRSQLSQSAKDLVA